ncbi:MAG: hypothetical protein IK083_09450 [Abditibacteriota bacterium]|nr:hypothetical protein [Abditibacteriota bacterium]
MKLVSVACLILCVFLVSQNMENRRQLSDMSARIGRLEKSMASPDNVSVMKAGALLERAERSLAAGDKDKALEDISLAKAQLGRVPEEKTEDASVPDKVMEGVAETVTGVLKDTVKKLLGE